MDKKEVKNQLTKEVKKNFLLNTIIDGLNSGKYPQKIAEELSISKQKMNYYIRNLKKQGVIEKKGYGVWEVKKSTKDDIHLGKKETRGHAFIWKVKIKNLNLKEILETKKIDYILVGLKNTPRIVLNAKKIWLGKESIVIYDSNSFYGINSIESKKYAVSSLLETLRLLEDKLSINLKPYIFTTSRQHYALVKNELAIQCNKNGEKIHIYDKGERWLMIDDSTGDGGELENEGKNSLPVNKQMQEWWNQQKDTKFEVTPKFVLNVMNGIQSNQLIFAENMKSHVKAIQDLSKGVNQLVKLGVQLKNENWKLSHKDQTKLGDYF